MQVINYRLTLGLGKFEPHFPVKLPLRLSRNAETPAHSPSDAAVEALITDLRRMESFRAGQGGFNIHPSMLKEQRELGDRRRRKIFRS